MKRIESPKHVIYTIKDRGMSVVCLLIALGIAAMGYGTGMFAFKATLWAVLVTFVISLLLLRKEHGIAIENGKGLLMLLDRPWLLWTRTRSIPLDEVQIRLQILDECSHLYLEFRSDPAFLFFTSASRESVRSAGLQIAHDLKRSLEIEDRRVAG